MLKCLNKFEKCYQIDSIVTILSQYVCQNPNLFEKIIATRASGFKYSDSTSISRNKTDIKRVYLAEAN